MKGNIEWNLYYLIYIYMLLVSILIAEQVFTIDFEFVSFFKNKNK